MTRTTHPETHSRVHRPRAVLQMRIFRRLQAQRRERQVVRPPNGAKFVRTTVSGTSPNVLSGCIPPIGTLFLRAAIVPLSQRWTRAPVHLM